MSNVAKHKFVNGHADGADATKTQPSNWNEEHVFQGGATGALLFYDAAQSDKVNWVATAAAGNVLLSAGAAAPTWGKVTASHVTFPATGQWGYWTRSAGAVVSPQTATDKVDVGTLLSWASGGGIVQYRGTTAADEFYLQRETAKAGASFYLRANANSLVDATGGPYIHMVSNADGTALDAGKIDFVTYGTTSHANSNGFRWLKRGATDGSVVTVMTLDKNGALGLIAGALTVGRITTGPAVNAFTADDYQLRFGYDGTIPANSWKMGRLSTGELSWHDNVAEQLRLSTAGLLTVTGLVRVNGSSGFTIGNIAGVPRIQYAGTTFTVATAGNDVADLTADLVTAGSVLTGAGAAATPSLAFAADPDTGLYRVADGSIGFASNGTYVFAVLPGYGVSLGGDVNLYRDGAAVLALKNGTTAQEFRVYGTTTGPVYGSLSHNGTHFSILANVNSDRLILGTAGTARWQIFSGGVLGAYIDNTYDVGAAANYRPRDLFLARDAVVGGALSVGATPAATGTIRVPAGATVAWADSLGTGTAAKVSAIDTGVIANDGVFSLAAIASVAWLDVLDNYGTTGAFYFLQRGVTAHIVSQPVGYYSSVKDTAGKINIYWATDHFEIQNKVGSDAHLHLVVRAF